MTYWKKYHSSIFVFFAFLFGLHQHSLAADISISLGPDGESNIIHIRGEIVKDDEKTFRTIALKAEQAFVVLNSPGGDLRSALEIGKIIRIKDYSTVVMNSECVSACALIWLAGQPRFLQRNSRIGFHAAYTMDEDGKKSPAGRGNALVGSYLNSLGFNETIVSFVTKSGANEISWLNKENAEKIGLSVSLLDNSRTARTNFNRAIKDNEGNKPPIDETIRLYRQAADEGFAGAQNNLGDLYERGFGVKESVPFAIYWYSRSAERGEPTAYLSLSTLLSNGTQDEDILTEALKFALLAVETLPEGHNKSTAESTARSILANLSIKHIEKAVELSKNWNPLFQEKYLMADTPNKDQRPLLPTEETGTGRFIDLKNIGIHAINSNYTKPLTAKGSWTTNEKGSVPNKGNLTVNFGVADFYTENGKQLLKVKEEIQIESHKSDTKPTISNLLLFIEPDSYRVIREIDEDETTNYSFSVSKREKMRIGDRIRVGSLETVNDKGVVTETGDIFEELRMSLQIPGALEYCDLTYKKIIGIEKVTLSSECEIFYEPSKLLGLSSTVIEYPALSIIKVNATYIDEAK